MEVCALVISILALCLSIVQFLRDSTRQKKESTLNAYNKIQDSVFSKLNNYTDNVKSIKYRSKEWEEVTICLSILENFSTGINTNIYSFITLNRLGGAFFIRQFEKFKPIIEKKREHNVSKGKHYDEFEKTILRLSTYRNTKNQVKRILLLMLWYLGNLF